MKPGLKIGETAEVEITVTTDLVARFEGETVHELYSTSSLVHHLEWAARRTILPYLEDDEEGMGCHVDVSHLAMTIPGMKVRVKATVTDVRDNKVFCDVEAFNQRGKIARATVTQAVVNKSWLDKKIRELTLIHQLAQ